MSSGKEHPIKIRPESGETIPMKAVCILCSEERINITTCGNCLKTPICSVCMHDDDLCLACNSTRERELYENITETLHNLFCVQCGAVKPHVIYRGTDNLGGIIIPWCDECFHTWNVNEVTKEQLVAEGVDVDWLYANWYGVCGELDQIGQDDLQEAAATAASSEEADMITLLWCSKCTKQTHHEHSLTTAQDLWKCIACENTRPLQYGGKGSSTNFYSGGYSYGGAYDNLCKHWRDPIKVGDYTVTASASSDRCTAKITDMVPDYGVYLSTYWQPRLMLSADFPRIEGVQLATEYPLAIFDWVDYSTPRTSSFMPLYNWVKEQIEMGKRIDIGCFGAHGRTGTFLALLVADYEKCGAEEAIRRVRQRHCDRAIESIAQENYIYMWCGEPIPQRQSAAANKPAPNAAGQNPNRNRNNRKYPSNQAKKEAKNERKRRRRNFKQFIETCRGLADKEGMTWEEYRKTHVETNGIYMKCDECWTWGLTANTTLAQSRTGKWFTRCSTCDKGVNHSRPEYLFEDTRRKA